MPEPVVEAVPEPEPEIEVAIEVTAEAETEIAATTDPEVISEQEATAELNEAPKSTTEEAASQPEAPALQNSDVFGDEAEDDQPDDQDATESTLEPETPQPAISLTVVYDPENANAGITTMASTPIEAKSSVENENATQVEVETAVADAPVTVKPADSADQAGSNVGARTRRRIRARRCLRSNSRIRHRLRHPQWPQPPHP